MLKKTFKKTFKLTLLKNLLEKVSRNRGKYLITKTHIRRREKIRYLVKFLTVLTKSIR